MRDRIDKIIRYLLVLIMGILVINVIWQVFTRYILQSPSTFTGELSRFLLIWVSLLGAAYTSGKKMHLAIDLLPSRLNDRNNRRLNILINGLILCFVVSVMMVGGSCLAYLMLDQPSPALGIPMGYVYCVVPISGLLIFYYKMCDLRSLLQTSSEKNQV